MPSASDPGAPLPPTQVSPQFQQYAVTNPSQIAVSQSIDKIATGISAVPLGIPEPLPAQPVTPTDITSFPGIESAKATPSLAFPHAVPELPATAPGAEIAQPLSAFTPTNAPSGNSGAMDPLATIELPLGQTRFAPPISGIFVPLFHYLSTGVALGVGVWGLFQLGKFVFVDVGVLEQHSTSIQVLADSTSTIALKAITLAIGSVMSLFVATRLLLHKKEKHTIHLLLMHLILLGVCFGGLLFAQSLTIMTDSSI